MLPALVIAPLLSFGCKEDHPYTPFQVASALPSSPPAALVPAPEASAPAPEGFSAAKVIKRAKASSWQIAGRTLNAPSGLQFDRALRADFDADNQQEVVAWTIPKDDPLKRPELWLYPDTGKPKRLWSLPGFVPTGPNCGLVSRLTQTGSQTLTIDVTGNCEANLIARAPVRSIAVIAPATEHPTVLALRAASPGPGEQLELQVSSLDQDGDGRDDVTLNVTLHGPESGASPTTGKFLWYDRPAGASRDDSEPGVSMARLASTELVRAEGKTTSLLVPGAVNSLKRLYGAICAEAGTPRLFDAEGNPLKCGRLTTTFSRLTEAELKARLKNEQVLEAVGVLIRDAWFGYRASDKQLKEWFDLLADHLLRRSTGLTKWLDVELPRRGSYPRLSPLEFRSDGTLLAQNHGLVVSIGAEGSAKPTEQDAPAVSVWPLTVVSPGRRFWTGVVYSCDRAELALSFLDASGVPLANEATRILAPRPGSCRGGKPPQHPEPVALGFTGEKLAAWVGGSRVGPDKPQLRPMGSALSPNGKWLILPTEFGLLVSGKRNELWSVPEELGPPDKLTDCVIDNAAQRAACTRRGRAALLRVHGSPG